jgi:hypothetical protein
MACGKPKASPGNLGISNLFQSLKCIAKEPFFDVTLDLKDNILLTFKNDTAQWSSSKTILKLIHSPDTKSGTNPVVQQKKPEPTETVVQKVVSLKPEIDELEKKLAELQAEFDKQQSIAKDLNKQHLLIEIRNELLIHLVKRLHWISKILDNATGIGI